MKGEWTRVKDQLYRRSSGLYYARLRVNGKPAWRSLKTNLLTIAKRRLAVVIKEEEERRELAAVADVEGDLRIRDIIKLRLREIELDNSIKPATKHYYEELHIALGKSWPDLLDQKVQDVSEMEVKEWGARYARQVAPTRFNNTLAMLVHIFEFAVNRGLRTRNPARLVKRRRPNKKDLASKLPTHAQFSTWLTEIRSGRHRWADDCADLVELLAYSGMRIGEARELRWKDCDFGRGELVIIGDAREYTKNGEIRRIPMIPALKTHLQKMKRQQPAASPGDKVIQVSKAQEAMDAAAKRAGLERLTHHDLRHLFATTCIESGVDIPTVSRWLGHKDGGALAMKVYGHLRNEHSFESAKKVSFRAHT
jgi:integrase